METKLITTEECIHPKLASWQDIFSHAHCYKCMGCGKEISIPALTLVQASRSDVIGIIGLAFGEVWQEKFTNGDYERRWS